MLSPPGIGFGKEILAKDQAKWTTGRGGGRLAVEMLGQPSLQVGGVAHVQVTVAHGEEDINAEFEFGGHPLTRILRLKNERHI